MDIMAERNGMFLLLLLMALYCVVGMVGFDPSKQDEGYVFGIILEYWRGGDWVVPMLAGEPFVEKPPLYYLVGAAFVRGFSHWLPPHDAARLASGFFTALTAAALALAARIGWGPGCGRFAVLALFGSLGLLIPAHMLLTDNAQLTGMTIALLGLAAAAQAKPWAGVALGTGAGIAFLAKGLFGPGAIASSALVLLCLRRWRTPRYGRTLLVAALFALPWLTVWPLLLYGHSPALFADWLWQNNFGRFFGFAPARFNAVRQADCWYRVLPWATFPVLPLALAACWRWRRDRRVPPVLPVALIYAGTVLAALAVSASVRAIYALPVLPALALLAAPLLRAPPGWVSRALSVGGWALFAAFAGLSWSLWIILALGRTPPGAAQLGAVLTADLNMPVRAGAALAAAAATMLWLVAQWRWRAAAWRGPATWYASVFVLLALTTILWVPWVDAAKSSYRPLYRQMAAYLPAAGCVASIGLGESQRGMLDYVLGVKTRRGFPARHCDYLLIDGAAHDGLRPPPQWRLVWSGARTRGDREQFRLYRRVAVRTRVAARRPAPAQSVDAL
jgi:4-amino-4-deoxy-L-arabinose transferase-like glycosyltransferase